ncbi:hypothetical protein HZP71_06350 [Elizabethkingia anophelis]|nr:hypothetical protein [Elizabethkingia anophelis]
MEDELNWMDRNITPRTVAYKNFVKQMENTSPEHFFRDGERTFTDREKKFMSIHQSMGREFIQGSNFTLKTFFNSNQDFPCHLTKVQLICIKLKFKKQLKN